MVTYFECIVDTAQWTMLRERIIGEIEEDADSLRFYFSGSNWQHKDEHIGTKESIDQEELLII
jgi:CRISPR-associated protein Cas2